MKVNLALWFFILLFSYSCSPFWTGQISLNESEKPDWVDNIPKGYFVGVSPLSYDVFLARDRAVLNARKQIVESLGGIVRSEFVDYIYEGKNTQKIDEFSKSKIKIVSKNIVSVNPEKIFIEKLETKKGLKKRISYRAYVLVPFSKRDHDKFIMELIASTTLAGRKLLEKAKENANSGDIVTAMNVIRNIEDNINPIFELTGIRPSFILDLMHLKEDMNELKSHIHNRLRIQPVKDFYTGVWGSDNSVRTKVRVSLTIDGKVIPIREVEVRFSLLEGSADITESSMTDKNGVAECIVHDVRKPNDIVIEAVTDFNNISGLDNKACKIYIKLNNSVCSIIREKYIGRNENLGVFKDILLSKFVDRNFDMYDLSDRVSVNFTDYDDITLDDIELFDSDKFQFIAIGYLYITRYEKVDNGFYFVWANTGIKFYNLKTGRILAGFSKEEKVAGNSLEDAEMRAARKAAENLFKQVVKDLGI